VSDGDICPSCGAARTGAYCGACGEKRVGSADLTVRSFLGHALGEFASLDAKLPRTLWKLSRRPGALTLEWLRGRRGLYIRPLQLFLLANLVYFVAQPFTRYNGYNTTLNSQMHRQFYSEVLGIAETVRAEVARRGQTMATFEAAYNAKSEILAKTLILVMVPLFGLGVALLNGQRGRPFVQHLVFALHYYTWELLFVATAFLLVYSRVLQWVSAGLAASGGTLAERLGDLRGGNALLFLVTELPTVFLLLPYLYLATRRVYGGHRLACAAKALLLLFAEVAIMLFYRLILFRVTMLAV
jgi:hypothetical protein